MTVALAMNGLSYGVIAVGLWFWLWGTWPLLGNRSVLYKLHGLSVADTLGSMLIIVGLLLKIPREWPLLVLALISLAIWNTVLGYVLAYCSASRPSSSESPIPVVTHGQSALEAGLETGLETGIASDNFGEVSHDG